MTLGGSHCGLRSHHNLNLPESLAFVEHLCTLPMLDIFLPTLLQFCEVDIFTPISQMRKLRFKEDNQPKV